MDMRQRHYDEFLAWLTRPATEERPQRLYVGLVSDALTELGPDPGYSRKPVIWSTRLDTLRPVSRNAGAIRFGPLRYAWTIMGFHVWPSPKRGDGEALWHGKLRRKIKAKPDDEIELAPGMIQIWHEKFLDHPEFF